ncbi:nuclease domain-containing protein [Companilactobacillus mishanensis]|uniref:nuclease domain-containing protein n=2 Tax=Companilactobacillus mishanensis TaxID=2486008 RepID=UPI000F7757A1
MNMASQCRIVSNYSKEIEFDQFAKSENDVQNLSKDGYFVVEEDHPLNLTFYSDDSNDELDLYDLSKYINPEVNPKDLKTTEDGDCKVISNKNGVKVTIFEKSDSKYRMNQPFVADYYFKIKHGTETRFSKVKVNYKNGLVTDNDVSAMVTDLEDKIRGLAIDGSMKDGLIYKIDDVANNESIQMWARILDFIHQEKELQLAVKFLMNNMKFEIKKENRLQSSSTNGMVNGQAIRMMMTNPTRDDQIVSSSNQLNYDIKLNRYAKYILQYLIDFLEEGISFCSRIYDNKVQLFGSDNLFDKEYQSAVTDPRLAHFSDDPSVAYEQKKLTNQKDELDSLIEKQDLMSKFKSYIERVLQDARFREIKAEEQRRIPKALSTDPNYRNLYTYYINLSKKKYQLTLSKDYGYSFKRTSEMYEMWAYVKLLKELIKSGYEPTDGWIFGNCSLADEIPVLTDGTYVMMHSESRKVDIRLVYNESIPEKENTDAPESTQIYTTKRKNKPDIHLDIFKNDRIVGIIVFDTKYCPSVNVLKTYKTDKLKQFKSYKDGIRVNGHPDKPIVIQMMPLMPFLRYSDKKDEHTEIGTTIKTWENDYKIFPTGFRPGRMAVANHSDKNFMDILNSLIDPDTDK